MGSNVLNLDQFKNRTIVWDDKEITFKLPPVAELSPLVKIEEEVKDLNDVESISNMVADKILEVLPEFPRDVAMKMNNIQLREFILFVIGNDDAMEKKNS